jgi:beta-glucanase (GH16 family)
MSDLRVLEPLRDANRHRRGKLSPALLIGLVVVVVLALAGAAFGVLKARGSSPTKVAAAANTQPQANQPPAADPGPAQAADVPAAPATTAPGARKPTKAPATRAPAQPAVAGVPAPPAGFTLTWGDAFTGTTGTGLDRKTYNYDVGQGIFGTGEIETMTDRTTNVFHDGQGHLVLKALHTGNDPAKGWTSGRFETQAATFGAAKGGVVRMEASIQQPNVSKANGAGYWPAFWMLGNGLRTGGVWPGVGEIDILEDINGRSSTFGTLHCGVNPGGPCNESSGIGSGERACAGCQTAFHTYTVEIDRSAAVEKIRWFLDGRNYFTLDQTKVDAKTWTNAVDHPFFIIFDLAIGGGFPAAFGGGPNQATVSGGAMKVDYVAVYNKR